MHRETNAIEYALNVVKREIQAEFPDLTCIFMSHPDHKRYLGLRKKQEEILAHPAGARAIEHLKTSLEAPETPSIFTGLYQTVEKRFFSLVKKDVCLALFFINTDECLTMDALGLSFRHQAYLLLWQALTQKEQARSAPLSLTEQTIRIHAPALSRTERLRQNLLGDCFSAMMQAQHGEKNAIAGLMKTRCELALSATRHYRPEDFPFPIVLDSISLVYQDLKDHCPPRSGPVAHTIYMTKEIGYIYDTTNLEEWESFCQNAQKMAWAGHAKSEILGAALYSTDNAYTRTTGHIMAETLHINAVPLKNHEQYNPFEEQESNARHHFKRAKSIFEKALGGITVSDNPSLFLMETERLNALFLKESQPSGWCALPLIDAFKAYNASQINRIENISQAFAKTLSAIPWADIETLHGIFLENRRTGNPITPDLLAPLFEEHPALSYLKGAFFLPKA